MDVRVIQQIAFGNEAKLRRHVEQSAFPAYAEQLHSVIDAIVLVAHGAGGVRIRAFEGAPPAAVIVDRLGLEEFVTARRDATLN